jgi:hypothetical protein
MGEIANLKSQMENGLPQRFGDQDKGLALRKAVGAEVAMVQSENGAQAVALGHSDEDGIREIHGMIAVAVMVVVVPVEQGNERTRVTRMTGSFGIEKLSQDFAPTDGEIASAARVAFPICDFQLQTANLKSKMR